MTTDADWIESMPAVYDRCLGPALFAPYASEVAERARLLAPRRVLELAAGTGIATAQLVRALPTAEITATDLNPAMISWGAERVSGARWAQADAEHLTSFAADVFDLVVCQFGVMFFPDKSAAFAEIARVLSPGGTVLLTTWDIVDESDFPAAMVASLAAVFPDDPPDFIVRIPHGYADISTIEADLNAAGLVPDRLDRVVLRGSAASARDLAEGFCLGTPLRFALEQRGPLGQLTQRLADEMTTRLGEGPINGSLAAFVISAHPSG
ncbi:MAG: ubiE 4 [Frankiales bacterium]|nr:ubiE 4 [Frankiales bacterium]